MWRKFGIFILIILFLSVSGCSQIGKPPATPTVPPTPIPGPKYTMGDIVKKNLDDNIGKIILDFDLQKRTYKVRTILTDGFGRIYYIKDQKEETKPIAEIESNYPVKTGNIDNPYGISEISSTKPKFNNNTIHKEEENKNNGIIILSFDYATDEYTYAYAYYKGGGVWDYDTNAKHTGDRKTIEDQYIK